MEKKEKINLNETELIDFEGRNQSNVDDGKISVDEFIEKYKKAGTANLKEQLVKDLNVRKYIPFLDKMDLALKVATATTTDKEGNYKVNSPAQYLISMMVVIDKYTKLKISEGMGMYQDYDKLSEADIFDEVIALAVPAKEISEFETILNMMLQDLEINKFSTQAVIRSFIQFVANRVEGVNFDLKKLIEEYSSDVTE